MNNPSKALLETKNKINGWLIVNSFIDNAKWNTLYKLLSEAARENNINLKLIKSKELKLSINELKKLELPEFVLFWDKDIVLAEMLTQLRIMVFNRADAIRICDDKALTTVYLETAGVPVPKTLYIPMTFPNLPYRDCSDVVEYILNNGFSFPFILKENKGSFGEQVYLIKDVDTLNDVLDSIGSNGFIIQEFIKASAGQDIRVAVVGDEVITSMRRFNTSGDFRSNISLGGSAEVCKINEQEKSVALSACKALGLDFAGVDLLRGDNGEVFVCEVNSNLHFASLLKYTGVNMAEAIMKHIKRKVDILIRMNKIDYSIYTQHK